MRNKKVLFLTQAAVIAAIYVVLTIIVYGERYEYEEKMNRIYIAKLKHLDKRYDIRRRARKMERERRGR